MIKGLYQIGKIYDVKIVDSFVEEIEENKKNKKYIIEINFDTGEKKISLSSKEYSKGDEYEYNFIKMRLTGRQNQIFVVFTDVKRIYGDGKSHSIWISLKNKIEDRGLENKISQVEEIFYENYKLKEEYKKDCIEKYLKNNNINNKEIAFWVVKVDNKYIHNNKSYLNLIEKKVLEEKAEKGKIICHLCSKETEKFYTDFSRLKMKIYINDKVGFSQNISNNWEGNFALCENCYKILIRGQSFVLNKFNLKVGSIDYLIIPEFIKEPKLNKDKLERWSEYVKFYKNPFEFFKNEFEENIEYYIKSKDNDNFVLLNYLFYEKNNQQFKVFGLIKDIPNGRIEKLREEFKKIINEFRVFFEDGSYIIKNLSDIYYLIPLRISDNKIVDIQKIMNLFFAIFNENVVDIDNLIYDFTLGFRAIYYENSAYHLSKYFKNKNDEIKYILKTHQLLKFLKGGESDMNFDMLLDILEEDYKNYIKTCSFDEKETALFLLGIVIAKIGSIQYTSYKYKPILEKVNFSGMNKEKLIILYNEVLEKMKQLEIYGNYEVIYSLSKQLFDKNFKNWDLKSYENTYFILSGYAFETYRILKGG
jgi:CRISPR-associated protein Csh1